MSTYAIGDLQGCFAPFTALLAEITFDPENDHLWLCGDLVNRGPESAKVLRFIRGLGERAVAVLGNHDLALLAVAAGTKSPRKNDTHDNVLAAPDRDELIHWLRRRPLLHHDPALGFAMVHAGFPPQWDRATAARRAGEVASVLGDDTRWTDFVANMYGNEPDRWSEGLTGWDRLRFITNALTRLRYCREDGALDLEVAGPPGAGKAHLRPWFELTDRHSIGERIVFGHWATLALQPPTLPDPARSPGGRSAPAARTDPFDFFTHLHERHGVYPLDTGCVWGNRLTALRLEDRRYFSVPCSDAPGVQSRAPKIPSPKVPMQGLRQASERPTHHAQ
uniref:Bis(5'-nucleosyl)-tetraphosphatase, symmetrical n=1 Tax=Candidatus Kentrum eta TaxID=2126337 RepID=A0A450V1Z0_9GAMM|nr:MAG: Bis(5'nucleosyl)-tetraphosphatase, ApaH [Candidatus Kentron sp. H]VFJ91953.1 MAG: Bis(5'nucleosyl)-tetraphosphatase, ApaH [Candidatus Kentron sp. H]VFJ98803.1 MAG: Bis(5'nucleosyl)-tetraphosphatase, ApaH [Candidatus Kentron sp. H]